MLTALLIQGTLVVPLTTPMLISLPAVLVAGVALVDGPAAGMSFGFALGLIADLGSRHPAGILALSWLGLGLVAGQLAGRRSVRSDAVVGATLCAITALVTAVLLTVVHADGATVLAGVRTVVPTFLCDALIAIVVFPLARGLLRADALRPARSSRSEFLVGVGHG
jgi:cell shape-determining protein MreD